jgi:hypothetical protein
MVDFITGVISYIIISLLYGFIVFIVWNTSIPEIFGLNEITYLNSVYLYVLCDILFKNTKIK